MKRTVIYCLFFIGFILSVDAGDGGKGRVSSRKTSVKQQHAKKQKHTFLLKDTVRSSAKSFSDSLYPEKGFDNLFENSAAAPNGIRLNPRALSFVQDYMDKETKNLDKMKDWGRPYFSMMDAIFVKHGLPIELKYLAVIESQLKSRAISWAGAVGPWQFMPATARCLGLKVSAKRDDRTDYYKSTRAAAVYLKDLFNEFGDWLLVIAAYNGGPANVYSAIRKSGSRNFWALQYYLPAESRNHVKKFIGTHYIFEGQGGITTLTKAEATEQIGSLAGYLLNRNITAQELNNSRTTTISGKYHSMVIAKYLLMDIEDFNRYNPDFDRLMATSDNAYELKLPPEKMDLFIANKYQILNESVQLLLNGATVTNLPKSFDKSFVK